MAKTLLEEARATGVLRRPREPIGQQDMTLALSYLKGELTTGQVNAAYSAKFGVKGSGYLYRVAMALRMLYVNGKIGTKT